MKLTLVQRIGLKLFNLIEDIPNNEAIREKVLQYVRQPTRFNLNRLRLVSRLHQHITEYIDLVITNCYTCKV